MSIKPNFNINGLYSTIYPNNLSVKPIIKLSLNLPIEKINSSIGIHFDNYYTIGFETRRNFGVNYGYQHKINNNLSLGFGSDFTIQKSHFNNTNWIVGPSSTFVPVDEISYIIDIDLGIWVKYKEVQFGITMLHANQPSYSNPIYGDTDTNGMEQKREYNLICIYDVQLNDDYTLRNTGLVINNLINDRTDILISNVLVIKNTYQVGITTSNNTLGIIIDKKFRISPILGVTFLDQFHFIISMPTFKIYGDPYNVLELAFKYNMK